MLRRQNRSRLAQRNYELQNLLPSIDETQTVCHDFPYKQPRFKAVFTWKCLCLSIALFMISATLIVSLFWLQYNNVHTSQQYVNALYTADANTFDVQNTCSWDNNRTINKNHPNTNALQLASRFLNDLHQKSGIISIIRCGSFLHRYRGIRGDDDMDIYMIIPQRMTIKQANTEIHDLLQSNFEYSESLRIDSQNPYLMAMIMDKSDQMHMFYDKKKFVDIEVIHESFIIDKYNQYQYPCMCGFHCKPKDEQHYDSHFQKHYIPTSELFGDLCKCDYFGSELFCFNDGGYHYLAMLYNDDFMKPNKNFPKDKHCLLYPRPYTHWINIMHLFPSQTIKNIKQQFVQYQL